MAFKINEAQLEHFDVSGVTEVLLSAPGEEFSGIQIFDAYEKSMAPFVAPHMECEPIHRYQLVIEVEDPDSEDTRKRILNQFLQRREVK